MFETKAFDRHTGQQISIFAKESIFGFWVFVLTYFFVYKFPILQARIFYILANFWWLFLPFMIARPAWEWWKQYWELRFAKKIYDNLIFLRVQLPPEVERTPKGMEQVFGGLHGMTRSFIRYTDRVFFRIRPEWLSFELVGVGGALHFIIACEKRRRDFVESHIYSQYPESKIEEVADYTQAIPASAPNAEWKMWGVQYVLEQQDYWILQAYKDTELDKESEAGRKVDPMAQWAETCASLKPGEQIWIQMVVSPRVSDAWFEHAKDIRTSFDKGQGGKLEQSNTLEEVFAGLGNFFRIIAGKEAEDAKKEERQTRYYLSEIEKNIVKQFGSKLTYPMYDVNLRAVYWGSSEVYDRGRDSAINGFFRPFDDYTNNNIRMDNRTRIRNRYFPQVFPKYRLDKKARRILWTYKVRYLTMSLGFRLNTTELASIYHFPGREAASGAIKRLPFKQAQPPADLPTI